MFNMSYLRDHQKKWLILFHFYITILDKKTLRRLPVKDYKLAIVGATGSIISGSTMRFRRSVCTVRRRVSGTARTYGRNTTTRRSVSPASRIWIRTSAMCSTSRTRDAVGTAIKWVCGTRYPVIRTNGRKPAWPGIRRPNCCKQSGRGDYPSAWWWPPIRSAGPITAGRGTKN